MIDLSHLNILDLSTRLPGPMSTMILADLGAKVIKLENSDHITDAFNEANSVSPNFKDWYDNLNQAKEIKRISFQKESNLLEQLITKADIIIAADSNFAKKLLASYETKVIIYISGSNSEHKAMHDINALGLSKVYRQYLTQKNELPFIPVAGVVYAQYIATACLAAYIEFQKDSNSREHTLFMDEVIIKILDSLFSDKTLQDGKFLHTGAFPCYNLYRSKENKSIQLAAVEEKYWKNFLNNFELSLTIDERFDTTGTVYNKLALHFSSMPLSEITLKARKSECCLTAE